MRKGAITYHIKICPSCGTEFTVCFKNKKRTFCSKKCSKSTHFNPQWKGDNAKYAAIHIWVANKLGRPDCCSNCGVKGSVDLANISNRYKRDISDWEWLCRKCHMGKDGRLDIFLSTSNKNNKLKDIECLYCGKSFHPWNHKVKFCSLSCSGTFNNLKRDYSKYNK